MRGIALGVLCWLVIATGSAVAQAPAGALGSERFAQIDAVYAAAVTLDEPDAPASALTAFRRTCNELGRADPLLAALRTVCLSEVRAYRALTPASQCDPLSLHPRKCLKLYRKVDATLGETISRSREANSVIASQVPDTGCRAELRASAADIRFIKRARRAFRLLARAVLHFDRTGDGDDVRRALERLAGLPEQPSVASERARFQRACGPSQPL